jgi:hypothetical protein
VTADTKSGSLFLTLSSDMSEQQFSYFRWNIPIIMFMSYENITQRALILIVFVPSDFMEEIQSLQFKYNHNRTAS